MNIFSRIKDRYRCPAGKKRSSKWRKVRKNFLKKNPVCAACGKKKKLQVHHIIPFNINPGLELEESNLITLCTGKTINCHLIIGHRGNFKQMNLTVHEDAEYIRYMLDDVHDLDRH